MGKLSANSQSLQEEFYVVEGLQTPLLGRMASSKLNLIQKLNQYQLMPIKLMKLIQPILLKVTLLCLKVLGN